MKRLKVNKEVDCMNCLSCLDACATTYFKTNDLDTAALRIDAKMDKFPVVTMPVTCIQCGKCARNCPENAITQNKFGVYMVNKKLCTGCGTCVEVCPMKVMRKPESSATAFKCIACGKCVTACPMDMLYIEEK